MTEVYLANVTKQVFMFAYRVPERAGFVTQMTPIGGQVLLAPNGTNTNLTQPEVDAIIKQFDQYGVVPLNEVGSSKVKFYGYAYSLDKEISVAKLHEAMKKSEEGLEEQGRQIRLEAAVATNNKIEAQLGERLRQLEMSVVEEEPRGGYNDDHTPVGEGVRVVRDDEQPGNTLPFIGRGGRRR